MLLRTVVPALALATVLGASAPVVADPGVPVSHDRVVKRDRAGDVQGDGSTPIDIRKVQYDHYQTGSKGRLVITVAFSRRVRKGSELHWGASTGPGGWSLGLRATVGGGVRLERGGDVVRKPRIQRDVDGRRAQITVPWGKLGSPDKLVGPHFWAELFKPPEWAGVDEAFADHAVLH